jgi:hypothetical protein
MGETKLVRVSEKTHRRLTKVARYGQSMDEVITALLDARLALKSLREARTVVRP